MPQNHTETIKIKVVLPNPGRKSPWGRQVSMTLPSAPPKQLHAGTKGSSKPPSYAPYVAAQTKIRSRMWGNKRERLREVAKNGPFCSISNECSEAMGRNSGPFKGLLLLCSWQKHTTGLGRQSSSPVVILGSPGMIKATGLPLSLTNAGHLLSTVAGPLRFDCFVIT